MRCAGPHGHTTWLGVWVGVVSTWVFSVGAEQGALGTPFRVADGRAGDPAPSTVWLRRAWLCAWCAPCAHPLARGAELLVARQHATSVPTSLLRGKRLPDHPLEPPAGGSVLSSCSLCDAVARRVGQSFGGGDKSSGGRM